MTEQQILDAAYKTFERTLEKNFNNIMPGVKAKEITFAQFKKECPHLMKVILLSMADAYTHKL